MKKVTAFGKEYPSIKALLDEYGISRSAFDGRINRGYSVEEAITTTREETYIRSLMNFETNHKCLKEEDVVKRIEKYGYKIIDFNYTNNRSGLLCYDKNGYKVICVLDRIQKGNKPFIFSVTSNADNFIFNINHYIELNNINNKALEWKFGAYNHPDVLFECACGNTYWANFQNWIAEERTMCPKCRKSISSYEQKVEEYLIEIKIKYERQYRFDDCKYKKKLPFDFYLNDFNACIEVDGEMHFKRIEAFEREYDNFETARLRDEIKTEYCKNNSIPLLRIPYYNFNKDDSYKRIISNFVSNI